MADPIVVPDICRFTVRQSMEGVALVNVLDYEVLPEVGTTRAEACAAQAGRILGAWHSRLRTFQSNQLTLMQVDFLDLDDIAGSVGTVTTQGATTWPVAGANADASLPTFVAMRFLKNTTAVRGQRGGSLFLCGVSEGYTDSADPNTITAGSRVAIATGASNFLADSNRAIVGGPAPDWEANMVIVHRRIVDGSPVYTHSPVETMGLDIDISRQVKRAG
jgi:hypothetical protein